MNKENLLKMIADTAYNVGFGAKKHLATFDIVEKTPGWIGFVSLSVGVLALFIDVLATKHMSAIFIVLGIVSLIITQYNETKTSYEIAGKELTKLFNELKNLYFTVKSSNKSDCSDELAKLKKIEENYYPISISKQILFSDWYAHYKFFWQHQIEWIDEEKHFKLFRDKIPLSFLLLIILLLITVLIYSFCHYNLMNIINVKII